MVLTGGAAMGIYVALGMKKRVDQLRELERIINFIEGEISYKNSLIWEALHKASIKCGQPFDTWLLSVSEELKNNIDISFNEIWEKSLGFLKDNTSLKDRDIGELINFGQALSCGDIKTMVKAITLEKENIHNSINTLNINLMNNMKISIVMGILGGMFLVIILV